MVRTAALICVAAAWPAWESAALAAPAGSLEHLPPATAQVAVGEARTERVIVRFRRDVGSDRMRATLARRGARLVRALALPGWAEAAPASGAAPRLARSLEGEGEVLDAEPSHVRTAFAPPNDLLYTEGVNQRPYLNVVRMPQAWEVTTGSDNFVTAVLDTGADLDHPDLAARLVAGRDEVDGDAVAADENGHGTAVAGVLRARPASTPSTVTACSTPPRRSPADRGSPSGRRRATRRSPTARRPRRRG